MLLCFLRHVFIVEGTNFESISNRFTWSEKYKSSLFSDNSLHIIIWSIWSHLLLRLLFSPLFCALSRAHSFRHYFLLSVLHLSWIKISHWGHLIKLVIMIICWKSVLNWKVISRIGKKPRVVVSISVCGVLINFPSIVKQVCIASGVLKWIYFLGNLMRCMSIKLISLIMIHAVVWVRILHHAWYIISLTWVSLLLLLLGKRQVIEILLVDKVVIIFFVCSLHKNGVDFLIC